MADKIPKFDTNKFEIIDFLGKGAYGLVYLVRNKTNAQLYAVKQSLKECKDENQQKMFNKEIAACSKVQNPAILKIEGYSFDVFNNIDCPTIFTEFMPNKSLDKYLKPDSKETITLNSSQKYIILIGISIGMKTLHSHGIIHRDLKPGNVLLDENLYPHIGDFGVSFISDLELSQILMSTEAGTPLYQAPEILEEGKYNYKVDVYSFSLILYNLITGILPFSEYKSVCKLWRDISAGKRPDLTVIEDKSMRNFLELCWSDNPTKRPSFDDIIDELLDERYKNFFNVNEEELEKYLSLFAPETLLNRSANKILNDMNKKALNGDSNAMLKLAIMYDQGESNVEENKEEAIRYYRMACENDNSDAMIIYCHKLMKGDGIPMNKEEASKIYKTFADKGSLKAMNNYGTMLLYGDGIPANKVEAARYLKKSADLGNPKSMLSYGDMLMHGDSIPMNKKEAARYYKKSAEEGNETALINYTRMLLNGDGIPQNKKMAAKYFQMFISEDNPKVMLMYGIMLLIGDGITVNKSKASYFFKNAADQGEVEAMFNYGVMLFNGDGIQKDKKEAKKYIQMAIDLDYSNAKSFYENYMKNDSEEDSNDSSNNLSEEIDDNNISIDLTGKKIRLRRITTPLIYDVRQYCKIKEDYIAPIVFYDGLLTRKKFKNIDPSKRFNKIPGLHEIGVKNLFINCINQLMSDYPDISEDFLPKTFQHPKDGNQINDLDLTKENYIMKRRKSMKCFATKSELIPDIDFLVQKFISPYLIDGHKFDMRIYFIITNLKPLTLYRYNEGIVYFCEKPFNCPSDLNSCFLNKKTILNSESNPDFQRVRLASEIIKMITPDDENSLLKKIDKIAALTIISLYKDIVKNVNNLCEKNDSEFTDDNIEKIKPLNRFFNLVAFDLVIDNNRNPFIIDFCSNPGLKPISCIDKTFKFGLIKSEFELIYSLLENRKVKVPNWTKILPSADMPIKSIIKEIKNEIFAKSPKKKKVCVIPSVTYL